MSAFLGPIHYWVYNKILVGDIPNIRSSDDPCAAAPSRKNGGWVNGRCRVSPVIANAIAGLVFCFGRFLCARN